MGQGPALLTLPPIPEHVPHQLYPQFYLRRQKSDKGWSHQRPCTVPVTPAAWQMVGSIQP
jgi:hypothetical protein